MPTQTKERSHIYTVSELTRDIKILIENTFPEVWVEGEVFNFKHHTSGHMYLSLKDESAIIGAAIFRNVNQKIKFKLEDGMKVVCSGKVNVFGKKGIYQIIIEKLEPKGIGALQLAFEQLKKRLFQEGLFDQSRKKPIPLMPFSAGIVTSGTGAAIRDIMQILKREAPFLRIVIRPTTVQGDTAAGDIVKAIEEFNAYGQVDVLIVGRGGGGLEDLWAFNEEKIARAIAASNIPIISAVGHEIDWTIADFVSDLRAETPSAAAKLIVNKRNGLIGEIHSHRLRLNSSLSDKIHSLKRLLAELTSSKALKHPLDRILEYQQELDNILSEMYVRARHRLDMACERLKVFSEKLSALNPTAILSRGYSLSLRTDGSIIKDAKAVKKGEEIKTLLGKGSFISEVKDIEK